jgi:hypothetical protein
MNDLPPPPPPAFSNIIEMLASQALASMGKLPQAGTAARLDYAKYFIDLIEIVGQKAKAELSPEETNVIEGTLHYLRMMYVEETKPK